MAFDTLSARRLTSGPSTSTAEPGEVWAGRAVQELVREIRSSDTTLRAIFRRYDKRMGFLDEGGFRQFCNESRAAA